MMVLILGMVKKWLIWSRSCTSVWCN